MEILAAEMRHAAEAADTAKLDELKKKHASLRDVYETERAIPTWLVDMRVVGKYVAAQVVPLLSLTGVIEFITKQLLGT